MLQFKNRLASRFASDQSGAIAIAVAIAMFALMAAGGGAVDVWRKGTEVARLQAAVDAGALAAASSLGNEAEKRQAAINAFRSNFNSPASHVTEKVTFSSDGRIVMSASGTMSSSFLGVVGISTLNVAAEAEVNTLNKDVELALVLDVSGSMYASMGTESRMQVLRKSAHLLLDKLDKGSVSRNSLKVGMVPFNMTVNIGTNNSQFVTGTAHPLFSSDAWAGCVMERAAPYTNTLDYDGSDTSAAGKWQAYVSPPTPNGTVLGSCINKSNGTNSGYSTIEVNPTGSFKVQTPGPNYNCVRHSILPLTNRIGDVRTKIDSLTSESNMGTIIAPGVAWANRLLSSQAPFQEADRARNDLHKIMVVLTDGALTTEGEFNNLNCESEQNSAEAFEFDPASFKLSGRKLTQYGPQDQFSPYGFIKDSDPFGTSPSSWADVNRDLTNISLDACRTAKANGVEIYTIAVSNAAGPGTSVHELLKSCATDAEHLFYAGDAAGLEAAFDAIGERILNIHLSR